MSDPINPYAPPQSNVIPAAVLDEAQQLATPGQRLGAALLDGVIMMVITLPIMWLSGYFARATHGQAGFLEQLVWSVVGFGIMVAINWNHLGRGQTIGKGILNLRILRKNGTPADRNHIILKRILPIQLIALVPFIGGIFALVDVLCIFRSQRNTIHDDIAETKVVIIRS